MRHQEGSLPEVLSQHVPGRSGHGKPAACVQGLFPCLLHSLSGTRGNDQRWPNLLGHHQTLPEVSTRSVPPGSTWQSEHEFVSIILKAVKSYEDVPRRCRLITDKMMQWLIDTATKCSMHSSTRAIVDWILLACYMGFKASEWSQKTQSSYSRLDQPGSPLQAFTRLDFGFQGEDEPLLALRVDIKLLLYL